MRTVLIVDDNPLIRTGIRRILEDTSTWTVCGEAANGPQALQLAAEVNPDVIVMDLSMPGIDGLEATQNIKGNFASAKILLLTAYLSKDLAEIAFRAGVNGYLPKTATRHELIRALDTVAQGCLYVSPAILESTEGHLNDPASAALL